MKNYVNLTSKPIFINTDRRLPTHDAVIEQDCDIETNLRQGITIEEMARLVAKEVSIKSRGYENVIIDLPAWLFSLVEKELASHKHIASISSLAGSRLVRSSMFDYLRSQYEIRRMMKEYMADESSICSVNLSDYETHIDAGVLVRLVSDYTESVEKWKAFEADDWDETHQLEGEFLARDGVELRNRLVREGLHSLAERDVFKF